MKRVPSSWRQEKGVGMFLVEYPKFVPPCTLTYMGCLGLYRVKEKIFKEQIALF